MITLPNGDKWIWDEKELCDEAASKRGDYSAGKVPETTFKQFVANIIKHHGKPHKYTVDNKGGWWKRCYSYNDLFGTIAKRTVKTKFFVAHEMESGEVLVVYYNSGMSGYAYEFLCQFANVEAFHKAVCFENNEVKTLQEIEMEYILSVLEKHNGNKPAAAKELDVSLKTLYNKLNQKKAGDEIAAQLKGK